MSNAINAYDQIIDFISNETEKTLLLRGIADKEKHQVLLKALNAQGEMKGLVNLIHTSKDGMKTFSDRQNSIKLKCLRNMDKE